MDEQDPFESRGKRGKTMTVFDIIGPVMIGPSSSHTAGAVRLGRVLWKMLEEVPETLEVELAGSFAETGIGHGTDKAILAGCLGMHSWDERIPDAYAEADRAGIKYTFRNIRLPDAHPNTAVLHGIRKDGKELTIRGASIGGGNITITSVNGIGVELSGQYNALLIRHLDQPGCIADVTNCMADSDVNICGFRLSRTKKGGEAMMTIELDGHIPENLVDELRKQDNVLSVIPIKLI